MINISWDEMEKSYDSWIYIIRWISALILLGLWECTELGCNAWTHNLMCKFSARKEPKNIQKMSLKFWIPKSWISNFHFLSHNFSIKYIFTQISITAFLLFPFQIIILFLQLSKSSHGLPFTLKYLSPTYSSFKLPRLYLCLFAVLFWATSYFFFEVM